MKELIIKKNEAGQRFDKYLVKYLNKAGSGFIYKMLRKKNIVLNDKKATGNEKLVIGDNVKLYLADETIDKFVEKVTYKNNTSSNAQTKLSVIYEDDNILLVDKPYNVLSQKSKPSDISINEMAIDYLLKEGSITADELNTFKPSVCNRLDRNTTGLIAIGKSLLGSQYLSFVFKARSISKYYLALVLGVVNKSEEIEGYLYKDEVTNKVTIKNTNIDNKGEYIKTAYKPIKTINNMTLLEVKLITGKTHQIRAHLATINHPIIGDMKYGDKSANQMALSKYNVRYQLLHSYRLEFPKNIEGTMKYLEYKKFIAPLPKYWPITMED